MPPKRSGNKVDFGAGVYSRVEYAPHAFKWMSTTHSVMSGHIVDTESMEPPAEKLSHVDESEICIHPMVWTNPKTGEKSLQVHGQGVYKLYLKSSP